MKDIKDMSDAELFKQTYFAMINERENRNNPGSDYEDLLHAFLDLFATVENRGLLKQYFAWKQAAYSKKTNDKFDNVVNLPAPPDPLICHEYFSHNKWDKNR